MRGSGECACGASNYANREQRTTVTESAIEARLRGGSAAERDRRQPPPQSRPPPTVQQAVNSDISVNKHFGPNPFRGPKV